MGDAEHRCALLVGDLPQQRDHGQTVVGVERAGRFIGEQQAGALGQRAGDGDALLFAPR